MVTERFTDFEGAGGPFFVPVEIAPDTANVDKHHATFEGLTIQRVEQLTGDFESSPGEFNILATFCSETEGVRERFRRDFRKEETAEESIQRELEVYELLGEAFGFLLGDLRRGALQQTGNFGSALTSVANTSSVAKAAHKGAGGQLKALRDKQKEQTDYNTELLQTYIADLVYYCRAHGLEGFLLMGKTYRFEHGVLTSGDPMSTTVYGTSSTALVVYADRRNSTQPSSRPDIRVQHADREQWESLLDDLSSAAKF